MRRAPLMLLVLPIVATLACSTLLGLWDEANSAFLVQERPTPTFEANIGGFAWNDLDGNGIWTDDEPKIPGVSVTLRPVLDPVPDEDVHQITFTDARGEYVFSGVDETLTYHLEFSVPEGMELTIKDAGQNRIDSDPYPQQGENLPAFTEEFDPIPGDNLIWSAGYVHVSVFSDTGGVDDCTPETPGCEADPDDCTPETPGCEADPDDCTPETPGCEADVMLEDEVDDCTGAMPDCPGDMKRLTVGLDREAGEIRLELDFAAPANFEDLDISFEFDTDLDPATGLNDNLSAGADQLFEFSGLDDSVRVINYNTDGFYVNERLLGDDEFMLATLPNSGAVQHDRLVLYLLLEGLTKLPAAGPIDFSLSVVSFYYGPGGAEATDILGPLMVKFRYETD